VKFKLLSASGSDDFDGRFHQSSTLFIGCKENFVVLSEGWVVLSEGWDGK
jgi:hypothetical protein